MAGKRGTFIAIPVDLNDPITLRRILLLIVEKIDVLYSIRGESKAGGITNESVKNIINNAIGSYVAKDGSTPITAPLIYNSNMTFSDVRQLVSKGYVDGNYTNSVNFNEAIREIQDSLLTLETYITDIQEEQVVQNTDIDNLETETTDLDSRVTALEQGSGAGMRFPDYANPTDLAWGTDIVADRDMFVIAVASLPGEYVWSSFYVDGHEVSAIQYSGGGGGSKVYVLAQLYIKAGQTFSAIGGNKSKFESYNLI